MPTDAAIHLPSWVSALGLPSDEEVALLRQFLILDHPDVQREVSHALVRIETPTSTLAIEDLHDIEFPALSRLCDDEPARRRATAPAGRGPSADEARSWSAILA